MIVCDDVIYLVNESPEAHGIFDPPNETTTMVYCEVLSVEKTESVRAFNHRSALSGGLRSFNNEMMPRFVFRLSEYADYNGQKVVIHNGTRYRVIRSDVKGQSVELTVGEVTADARKT